MNANSVETVVEAAKEENLDVKIIVIGSLPGFVSLTDIIQDPVNPSEIEEFRCTIIDNPHDTAMICASSGTTGMPKGTELSYVSLYNSSTPIEEVHMINEVSLMLPTIRWHCGLVLLFEMIMSNAKLIIISKDICSDEVKLCKVIQDNKVSLKKIYIIVKL